MSASPMENHRIEGQFYRKLVENGYPEDRIAKEYPLDDYRADFAILPPGLAQEPMAIFEVKKDRLDAKKWLAGPRASKLRKDFLFAIGVYCADEDLFVDFDNQHHTNEKHVFPSYETLKQTWLKRRTFFSELTLNNFMVFKSAEFKFGSKLNVIIGENGSGKTQLLKLLYSIARSLAYEPEAKKIWFDASKLALRETFKVNKFEDFITCSTKKGKKEALVKFVFSENKEPAVFMIKDQGIQQVFDMDFELDKLNSIRTYMGSAVYLPSHELLSIFPGFNSLGQIYRDKWAYDQTYSDCMAYLGLPVIQSQGQFANDIIKEVEKAIHGHIYLNDQGTRFLMQMEKSKAIYEIPAVAEGWRKFGQLLQLINTGAINPGSILFWDEPDANQNPQLIRLLAKVIVELAHMDIQIFVTTHSLFFLRELDMLTKSKKKNAVVFQKDEIRFFNFLGNGQVEQGDAETDLTDVLLLDESLKQSDRYLLEDY